MRPGTLSNPQKLNDGAGHGPLFANAVLHCGKIGDKANLVLKSHR
jgi:hypothetical protein